MSPKILFKLLLIGLVMPTVASAVSDEDFKAKTTKNLINLCTTSSDDPKYKEAIHFCQGYAVGAYDYYRAANNGPNGQQLFCFPKPEPSRNEAIEKVVAWAQQHPEYMSDMPVETEFRALAELWPCKK